MSQIVKSIGPSKSVTVSGKFTLVRRTDTQCYFEILPSGAFFTYLGFNCGTTPVKFGIGQDARLEVRVGTKIYPIEMFTAPEADTNNHVAWNCQFDVGIPVEYRMELAIPEKAIKVYRQGIKIAEFKSSWFGILSWPGTAFWFDNVQQNRGRNTVNVTETNIKVD
jgi:hypothetical protein